MASEKVNLYDLKEWSLQENGRCLINKLISFHVLPNARKCPRGHLMILIEDSSVLDKFKWRCRNKTENRNRKKVACNYREVTFDAMIMRKTQLGGIGKTVEIDESKFGRRKYHRGHQINGQWVFGGYERESGECFLIPVESRNADTLVAIITEWIKPGTTILSDCWKAYDKLGEKGYTHLTVNHSIHFKDPETGTHTNTIESTWRHAKASLPPYKREKEFYGGYLAKYMFLKKCESKNLDPTIEFFGYAGALYNPERDIELEDEHDSDDDDDNDDEENDENLPNYNNYF